MHAPSPGAHTGPHAGSPPGAPKRTPRWRSVNARLSAGIVLVSSVALILFTLLDYHAATRRSQEELQALTDRVANRIALNLAAPAWELNRRGMLTIMEAEMQNRNVACIVYQDALNPAQRIALSRDEAWDGVEAPDCPLHLAGEGHVIARDITMRDTLLGAVRVCMTDRFQRREILVSVGHSFLRLLMLEALLVLALHVSMRRVIDPILDLSRVAARMTATRDYDERARGGGNDEIGALIRDFNTLMDEVRRRQSGLERHSRSLEDLVAERTRELEAKAAELEASNRRLQQLDDMKSAILATVSHEVRTPLASVLGFAAMNRKLFARHFLPDVVREPEKLRRAEQMDQNFAVIDSEGKRLARLINDFLDLSRVESGRVEWRDSRVDLVELARHGLRAAQGQLSPDSPVRLVDSLPPGPIHAVLDPDRFGQVLGNLLHNALKFTSRGEVEVRARLSPEGVFRLCVRDTGEGVPREDLQRVFDRFHQAARQGRDPKPGAGLGLAISRQIVEHYGGDIWVESSPGQGSRFYLEIPLLAP